VGWLRNLFLRWGVRNFSLVCPQCRHPASPAAFRRGRYRFGEDMLVCEQCGEASAVTFWRFEGLSQQPGGCGGEAFTGPPLANSRR
jgi:hypothetical protein